MNFTGSKIHPKGLRWTNPETSEVNISKEELIEIGELAELVEGTSLLTRQGSYIPSRVRIPHSPQ